MFTNQGKRLNCLLWLLCAALLVTNSHAQVDDSTKQLAHDIFKQLIEINTTDSVGNVTTAAEAVAQRFRAAGFPDRDIQVLGPNERKKNLVVRFHGSGRHRPVLLMGHLDVVEARREDWITDPFQFVEKDGYFYGRGTQDMKDGDAIAVATLIKFKKEGFVPDRDIILALTADEEGGKSNGVNWLLKNHRDLVDAEFVLNPDELTVWTETVKATVVEVEAAEKTYSDYQLVVTDAGGHSSLPTPHNAIYQLAEGLVHLQQYKFPVELNEITRAYYERMANTETGQRSADMRAILRNPPDPAAAARLSQDVNDNAMLRTTCVATRVNAGHANNALPQHAEAIVNCRLLPGHTKQEIREKLVQILADPAIAVHYMNDAREASDTVPGNPVFAPQSLRPDVLDAVEKVAKVMWPGTPVIPTMARGASDGIYTSAAGMPTYEVAGVEVDRNDDREHGRDERVGVESFYRGLDFYYRFLKTLTAGQN
jgi:acetylornithine deacetylase/succinyl-diaminopimelate desuccinylase-like protein